MLNMSKNQTVVINNIFKIKELVLHIIPPAPVFLIQVAGGKFRA